MIIIVIVIVSGISCLVLIVWWYKKMREIFLLNEKITKAEENDGKVVFTIRRKKK